MIPIQHCTIDHLVDCSEVFREVYSEAPFHEQWTVERSFEYLSRIYHFDPESCYIAEEDHPVIGAMLGDTFPWSSGTDLFIQELFVKSAHREKEIRA